MTKSLFKKISTAVLIFVLFYSVAVNPLVTSAQVATTAQVDTIDSLTAGLIAVGDQIMASPDITEPERLALMMSLVELSTKIIALRKTSWFAPSTTVAPSDAGKISAKDAKLKSVKVYYDYKTNQSAIVTNVNGTLSTTTTTFVELPAITNFENRMNKLRDLASAKVSVDLNVLTADIKEIIFVSARNPEVDRAAITQNAYTADYLHTHMGQNSIVNKVNVLPGAGGGRIEIFTDQEEELWFILTKELDIDGLPLPNGGYNYTYEYRVKTPFDINPNDADGNPMGVPPKVTQTQAAIPRVDVEKFIVDLFNTIPFTSRIPNFKSKVIDFLTDNRTQFVADQTSYNILVANQQIDQARDCFYSSDKVVMNEFVKYLLEGIGAQYEDIAAITHYPAPLAVGDDTMNMGTISSCTKDRKF